MKRRNATQYFPMLVMIFLLLGPDREVSAQVDRGTLWRDAVITSLDVDFNGTGFHARWRFHRCQCGDLQVQVEQAAPDSVLTGEVLMVDGQVLLARGFAGQQTDIVALIQAPSLMLQLAYSLLNKSEPGGPHKAAEKQGWNVQEAKKHFILDTGFATGTFAAPWNVNGSGWKTGPDQRRFELKFEFSNPLPDRAGKTESITFSGDLDYRRQDFAYPETTLLEGWRIQWFARGEDESSPVSQGLTLKTVRQEAAGS